MEFEEVAFLPTYARK